MLDLGTTFIAAVEREPAAKAIVDGDVSLTYGEWFERIRCLVGGLDHMGLATGDRVAAVLSNNWQMATLHWACQLAGITVTPLNWRVSPDELDYFVADAEAKAVFFEEVSANTVNAAEGVAAMPRAVTRQSNPACSSVAPYRAYPLLSAALTRQSCATSATPATAMSFCTATACATRLPITP